MKIPNKIKIGENEYTVGRFGWPFNRKLCGFINYQQKSLNIAKGRTERFDEENFFHELAHGILKEMEFNYPQIVKFRNDEVFVQELGLVMRNVVIDVMKAQEDRK